MEIENTHFKNVCYNGANAEILLIAGYNRDRKIKNEKRMSLLKIKNKREAYSR
jgi:hypothetical protein